MTTDVEDRANTRASCQLGETRRGKAAWASVRDEVGTRSPRRNCRRRTAKHAANRRTRRPGGTVSRMAKAPVLVLGVYVQWDR